MQPGFWGFCIFVHNLLALLAALEVPQADLDGSTGDFRPACLRVGCEDRGCFGVLDIKTQNSNDAIVNLDVCHRFTSSYSMATLRSERCVDGLKIAC